jgi:hypothetical protein
MFTNLEKESIVDDGRRALEVIQDAFLVLLNEDRDCVICMAVAGELIVDVLIKSENTNIIEAVIGTMHDRVSEWRKKNLQ